METKYIKIGELKVVNGETFVKPDYFDDGLTSGNIFKDEEAYEKDWGAICYVPEATFIGEKSDSDGFYNITGITHNELLDSCHGNREWCDALFSQLKWACPETYLDELNEEDVSYYYRFIKPGATVWWNNPASEKSGGYIVFGVPFEFDQQGELIEPEAFESDAIITIGDAVFKVEVTPFELTPIY